MKRLVLRLILPIFSFLFFSCHESEEEPRESKYDDMARLMEYEFQMARDPALDVVPTERLFEARQIRDEILEVQQSMRAAVPGITWEERGPANVGGRTRALWFDLADAVNGYRKVWAGGVSGGLWYTNDITVANPVWNKVNDLFDNLAISSFVQDPANHQVMYFATGEGWFNVDAVQGAGIWKTSDGGLNWSRLLSTQTFYYTQDLLIDRNGHLYATVRLANSGAGASGLQKSTNGGTSWNQVLTTPTASSNRGGDLELAANGDIYVSMGINQNAGGIYRSSYNTHRALTGNAGTWTNITPNLSGVIGSASGLWRRIELACAPSDSATVYALFQGQNSLSCTSIQQYNSITNTWQVRTVPTIVDQGDNSNFTRGQAFYDLIAAVDPNDAAVLFVAGIDALRSSDSGQTFNQISVWTTANSPGFTSSQYVHADHHAIAFAPASSSRVLFGTDGGIYYTTNANIGGGSKPSFTSKNTGYNVTQYYSVAAHPTNPNYFLAGAQDNGSHQFSSAGINNINEVTGGDGGFCHIDQDNPNVQITSYVYNNFFVSTNGASSFSGYALNDRGQFINPSDYSSSDNILYSGDAAGYYFRWSNPQNGPTAVDEQVAVSAFGTGAVSHVSVSPVTPGRAFFGLTNGTVVMVDNANTGLTKTGTLLRTGTGNVSCIAIDPSNENHLLVTYSNYGVSSVFESFNALTGSPTWSNVEGNLPDMPVRWAIFDPRNSDWAILATELGIWSTDDLDGTSTIWEPTNSGFANVRVDMLQYRSSDRTLVAATHGRGLFTTEIPASTTPDIDFVTSSQVANEENAASSGCRGYRDYTLNMTIANPPSGDATVTVSVQSGTAVEGVDFDFTTNGSFTSPSKQLVFANGSTESKTITIRIYDDADIEPNQNFVLSYTISGSTDAQPGAGAQTFAFTIQDNDQAPLAGINQDYTIGVEEYYLNDASDNAFPFDARLQRHRSQFLYRADELQAMGMTAGNIYSISFNLEKYSTRPYQNLSIRMGTSSVSYLRNGGLTVVPVTTVKTISSYSTVNGWNTFVLDAPFAWNGTSSIAVEICYDNVTADASNAGDLTIGYADGGTASQGNMFWQNINCGTSYSTISSFGSGVKPMARFNLQVTGTNIATAISNKTNYFAQSSDQYFYNNAGEIIARLRNLSATHDYGCTQVQIDRSGTGATPFWNNNPPNQLMDKTLLVTPSTNNASGSYEITLFYTDAEVQRWEAATGQSFSNIQLIKTENPIPSVSPSNPGAAGNYQIVSPIIGSFGTHHTLTYTFNDGFSGFGAGVAGVALPVKLVDFTGKLSANHVVLNWQTSFEANSYGFEIERSFEGQNFQKVGFVKAAGNTSTGKAYEFRDIDIAREENYYRLKQIDEDGRFEYSKTILVRRERTPVIGFRVLTNPVTNYIDVDLQNSASKNIQFVLSGAAGNLVTKWTVNSGQRIRLDLNRQPLSRGVFVLSAVIGGKRYSKTVVVR